VLAYLGHFDRHGDSRPRLPFQQIDKAPQLISI